MPNTAMVADGEQYTASCDPGFTLVGSATMTCTAGALLTTPICAGKIGLTFSAFALTLNIPIFYKKRYIQS